MDRNRNNNYQVLHRFRSRGKNKTSLDKQLCVFGQCLAVTIISQRCPFVHVCNKLHIRYMKFPRNKVLRREPGRVVSFLLSFFLYFLKQSSFKIISSLVNYKKVISSLVKYFTPEDTKTISLENNRKLT